MEKQYEDVIQKAYEGKCLIVFHGNYDDFHSAFEISLPGMRNILLKFQMNNEFRIVIEKFVITTYDVSKVKHNLVFYGTLPKDKNSEPDLYFLEMILSNIDSF